MILPRRNLKRFSSLDYSESLSYNEDARAAPSADFF